MESSPECIGRAPGVARITEQFVSQECPSSDIGSRQRELNSKLREQTRQRALSASVEAGEKEVFVRNKTGAIHRSNLILHPLRQCKDPGTASLYATTSLSTASAAVEGLFQVLAGREAIAYPSSKWPRKPTGSLAIGAESSRPREPHAAPCKSVTSDDMDPILLDSTDEQAVRDLVMSLVQNESTEYTVLNEHGEDITREIKKLVSLQTRMLEGR